MYLSPFVLVVHSCWSRRSHSRGVNGIAYQTLPISRWPGGAGAAAISHRDRGRSACERNRTWGCWLLSSRCGGFIGHRNHGLAPP